MREIQMLCDLGFYEYCEPELVWATQSTCLQYLSRCQSSETTFATICLWRGFKVHHLIIIHVSPDLANSLLNLLEKIRNFSDFSLRDYFGTLGRSSHVATNWFEWSGLDFPRLPHRRRLHLPINENVPSFDPIPSAAKLFTWRTCNPNSFDYPFIYVVEPLRL